MIALKDHGFKLSLYDAANHAVILGNAQCMFLRNSSILISRRELI